MLDLGQQPEDPPRGGDLGIAYLVRTGGAEPEVHYDSGTGADTSSDDPEKPIDFQDCEGYEPAALEEWLHIKGAIRALHANPFVPTIASLGNANTLPVRVGETNVKGGRAHTLFFAND